MTFIRERLGDHVSYLQRGKSPSYSDDGDVRVLNQKCIRWHGFELHHGRRLTNEAAKGLPPVRLLQPGDVVVNSTGEGTIGRANVWVGPPRERWVADSHVTVIRPAERLDSDWLKFWFQSAEGQEFIHAAKTGATKQTELAASRLADFELPLPSRANQRRIVSRIKACMERIEEIEALRADAVLESAAITPSLLNEVFVNVAGTAPSKSIDEVALETRYGTSNKCHTERSGVPILRIPNVAAGSVNFDDLKFCELAGDELRRIQLVSGDLLFVRTNGSRDLVGRCAVFEPRSTDDQVGFASYLIRVRLDPQQVLPLYLAYFLNSTKGREEINQRRRTSAGQFNINSENLRSILLPVPPVQEQARLIALMEERNQLARQLTGELRTAGAEGAQLRESVLRKAFAGEL